MKRIHRLCAAPRLHPLALAAGLALAGADAARALPQGENVVAGQVSVQRPGTGNMLIEQRSASGIVNWRGFSIGSGEAVRIRQPQSESVLLNRVVGSDPSALLGQLSANGKVFLVNPNGVLFGAGSRIDVGSLVALTLSISDADFLAGRYRFGGSGGEVVNEGRIVASERGTVALLGGRVRNDGVIEARLGTVALAAGSRVTLDLAGDGLSSIAIDAAALAAEVASGGAIVADGGQVLLSAGAVRSLIGGAVSASGVVRARSLVERDGRIVLDAGSGGTTAVSGTLDVSAAASGAHGGDLRVLGGRVIVAPQATLSADAGERGDGGKVIVRADNLARVHGTLSARGGVQGGDGGVVETSGRTLDVSGARVGATAPAGRGGQWLLDPTDITIDAALAGTLASTLDGGTSVSVETAAAGAGAGDITVNASIAKTAGGDATLTLGAHRDIVINGAGITSSAGRLNVDLNSNRSGTGGGVLLGSGTRIATNGGNLRIFGQGDPDAGFATGHAARLAGITLRQASVDTRGSTGDGSILMRGAGIAGGGPEQGGILMLGSTLAGGSVTLVGRTSGLDSGVRLDQQFDASLPGLFASSRIDSSGDVTITGTGGPTVAGGVELHSAAVEVTGSGRIAMTGIGGLSDGGAVAIAGDGMVLSLSDLRTSSGSIALTGFGGSAANLAAGSICCGEGVVLRSAQITSASGPIAISGNGSAAGTGVTIGVEIESGAPSRIRSAGAISITGAGGALGEPVLTDSSRPLGVVIDGTDSASTGPVPRSVIESTGAGVAITGSGGTSAPAGSGLADAADGVRIVSAELRAAPGQIIQINGAAGSAGSDINAGPVPAKSIAASDVVVQAAGGTLGLAGGGAPVALAGTFDVSGASGGSIVVQSRGLWTGPDTVMSADATGAVGNGGSIRLLSSGAGAGATSFPLITAQGAYSARGGFSAGNGGSIDVAGQAVTFAGFSANASVPNGVAGHWTIDGANVTITATPGVGSGSPVFSAGAPGTTVFNGDIAATLGAGTSVSIVTAGAPANGQPGDVTVNAPIAKTAGGNATLLLSAADDVVVAPAADIVSTAGRLNLALVSNSDGIGGGSVLIGDSSGETPTRLASNGGDIAITGGRAGRAGGTPGVAGIGVFATTIDSRSSATTGGAVSLLGHGEEAGALKGEGVEITGSSIFSASGDVVVDGIGGPGGAGVRLDTISLASAQQPLASQVQTTSGSIRVSGRSPVGFDPSGLLVANQGVIATQAVLNSSAGGAIDVRARGEGAASTGFAAFGSAISTSSGDVSIAGEATGLGFGIVVGSGTTIGGPTTSGSIVLRAASAPGADSLLVEGSVQGSGVLNIRPGGVASDGSLTDDTSTAIQIGVVQPSGTFSLLLDAAELARLQDGFSTIVFGSNAHIGPISIVGPVSFGDPVTLQNGGAGSAGIAIASPLAAPGNLVTLSSGGAVTQTAPITAGSLLLHGTRPEANFQLTGPGNQIGTLATRFDALPGAGSPAFGDINFVGSTAFAIAPLTARGIDAGTGVASTIDASSLSTAGGDFFARSVTGNLTLGHDVSTFRGDITLVSANVLDNAANAALLPGGGSRWLVRADTWVGENRGSLAGSTPLPNLYGCAFGAASCASGVVIPATGNHFVYTQQPTISVVTRDQTRPFGAANPTPDFVQPPTGLVNGDSVADAVGNVRLSHTATPASPSGGYPITLSAPLASPAGYLISFTPGTLSVVGTAPENPAREIELQSTDVYGRNFGLPALCSATGPSLLERAAQATTDLLSIEWSRVRQKPNLSNCLDLGQRNGCSDF